MPETSMKGFHCWDGQAVNDTVFSDIGALPIDSDSIFLAAHTPTALSHVHGPQVSSGPSGEPQVMSALLESVGDLNRNTLIAVTGGSGAGKSHVVRWVHAHLSDDERFHVLYVPRAVQTIRELLRRTIEGLPGAGGQELLERIDAAVSSSTPAELQDRVLAEMRHVLTWTLEPRPATEGETTDEKDAREDRNSLLGEKDEQGKRRGGLADLLENPLVNRTVLRTGGRLAALVDSYFQETSRRDEQQDGFMASDLPLREAGVVRSLSSNAELRELWTDIKFAPEDALSVLDDALRLAVPRTLGLRSQTGETLDELFRASRRSLRIEGKELVLLFEDLAQFGLIDGELYDQFATQPGEDNAPIRAVFAVTDGPYAAMPETVRTRITHEFRVGSSALEHREQFVSRYLNLVRVGREGVEEAWSKSQRDDSEPWVPNACETRESGLPCQFLDRCHAGFGTVEVAGLGQVGLYPYNDVALRRALDRQGEAPTPRSVLDDCVVRTLVEAEPRIASGTYPHERVREQFDFHATKGKQALVDGSGAEVERLYTALVVWGDENVRLPDEISVAFDLSISDAEAKTSAEQQSPPAAQTDSVRAPSPLESLWQWQNGTPMSDGDADAIRTGLYQLTMSRLDLAQDLYHSQNGHANDVLARLFNRTSFDIEDGRGQPAGKNSIRVPITRSLEDVKLLVAARWFLDHGHFVAAKGNWEWPLGFEPSDLLITLEASLDDWADRVSEAFRSRVGGRAIANGAVGLYALASAAIGFPVSQMTTLSGVASEPTERPNLAPELWREVESVAQHVRRHIDPHTYVAEFAAVRQGSGGAPQLVDAFEIELALRQFLSRPAESLTEIEASLREVAPEIANESRDLLRVIRAQSPSLASQYGDDIDELVSILAGETPSNVGQIALDIGRQARDNGLFASPSGWVDFEDSANDLQQFAGDLSLDPPQIIGGAVDEFALTNQYEIRRTARVAASLRVVQQAMEATARKSRTTSGGGVDIRELEQEVASRLQEVREGLQSLATKETGRG